MFVSNLKFKLWPEQECLTIRIITLFAIFILIDVFELNGLSFVDGSFHLYYDILLFFSDIV